MLERVDYEMISLQEAKNSMNFYIGAGVVLIFFGGVKSFVNSASCLKAGCRAKVFCYRNSCDISFYTKINDISDKY